MPKYMKDMPHARLELNFLDWWNENADDFRVMATDPHPVIVDQIKDLANSAFHNGAIARDEWQELTAPECEHEWRYGGVKYQEMAIPSKENSERYDHYDWYYCTRCLESVGKFLYASTSINPIAAFPMPTGGTFEQGPPALP